MFRVNSRKYLVVLAATLTAGLVLSLCGCGGGSGTAAKNGAFPDGAAAEYFQETGQMKTTNSTKKISATDLGVPVYPGARLENGTAEVEVDTCPVGVLETTQALLSSPDSVDKVSKWYKDELSSEPGFEDHSYSLDGTEHGAFNLPEADGSANVIVEKSPDGSGTRITVIVQKENTR